MAPDVAHAVRLNEVAQAAQREQSDQCERQVHDRVRIAPLERAVAECLREFCEQHHAGGEQRCAEHAEQEHLPMRAYVAEQAAIGVPRPGREHWLLTAFGGVHASG